MAVTKIDLGAISLENGAKFTEGVLEQIMIGDKRAGDSSINASLNNEMTSITVPNYGSLTIVKGQIVFTAAADITAGEYELVNGSAVEFGDIDLAAVTVAGSSFTGSAGNNVITGPTADIAVTLNGGAGNDTITAGGGDATVIGGTGADSFVQGTATDKKFVISDYTYSEGDKLTLSTAIGADFKLSSDGSFADKATGATVSGSVADVNAGLYQLSVKDTVGTTEFITAKDGENVTVDGSKYNDKLVINVADAKTAAVQGGFGNDSISLGSGQVTLTAGKSSGQDTVEGFKDGFNGDVLNLNGGNLADVVFGDDQVSFGATVLKGVGAAASTTGGSILVQENGGSVKKVTYANVTGTTFADANFAADVYLGSADKTTKLDISGYTVDGAVVNLQDENKYKNIYEVVGSANGGVYIGTADSKQGSKFDLTAAVKASEVWGGSQAADSISFKADNAVQDVMWFGTADGSDSVTGFAAGFGDKSDVLYLYDKADVKDIKVTTVAGGIAVEAAKGNTITLATTVADNAVQLQLKDAGNKVHKVAMSVSDAAATILGSGADAVIGRDNFEDTVKYDAADKDLVVNLFDSNIYSSIENVDLNGAAGSNVVIGSANHASKITLAGANTEVWGGSKDNDTITAGSGADVIWFGNNDGADVVTSFAGADSVKFYDKAVSEIASAYKWDNGKFVSNTNDKDSLNIGIGFGGTLNILDKDNNAAKIVVGTNALTYDKAAKAYMGDGSATLTVGNISEDVVLYLDNNTVNPVNDIYFSGVKNVDASAATGNVVLIGNAAVGNELTGGRTNSAMWGGGAASDIMNGNNGAVDEFWFGTGDGVDKANIVDKNDKFVLYNTASIDDITIQVNSGNFVITAKDGSTLTVTADKSVLEAGLSFQVGVNEAAQTYTYDTNNNKFAAKA